MSPEHQGRRLSSEILQATRSLAAKHGMHSLVAPVRLTLKNLYPLTSIEAGSYRVALHLSKSDRRYALLVEECGV